MAAAIESLDLVDIVVAGLRASHHRRTLSTDQAPRSRLSGKSLRSIGHSSRALPKGWNENARTWIVPDELDTQERQVPAIMKSDRNFLLPTISEQQPETTFYRIRAYDCCANATILLKPFLGLFPSDTKLRIRHAPKD